MTDTNNGRSPDPDEIERDIERTRADMQDTLDALQHKLSAGQLLDEALEYFRQGPGDFLQILGTTVRHNPVPVALLGISLGWLMLAGPRRPPAAGEIGGRERDRDYTDYRDYDELIHPGAYEDRYYTAETASARTARAYAAPFGAGGDESTSAGEAGDESPSTMDRLGAQASGLAQQARDRVADLASGVRERFGGGGSHDTSNTSSGVSGMARSARDTVSDMAESAQDTMSRAAHGAADRLGQAAEATRRLGRTAGEQAGRAQDSLSGMIYNNPIVVGAVGVAIGLALGYALPSTRREDEVLGPRRDELLERARQAGEEGLHKAQEVGSKVYETAKEEVRKQTGMSDQEESSGQTAASGEEQAGGAASAFGAEPGEKPVGAETSKGSARSKRSGSAA